MFLILKCIHINYIKTNKKKNEDVTGLVCKFRSC